MKKIKHIKDLKEEKMRLRIRQLELEKEIRITWLELKENFEPATLLKNKFAGINTGEVKEKGLLSSTLSRGAAYLTRRFFDTTGEKIESKVQRGVEDAVEKIKSIFGEKKSSSS